MSPDGELKLLMRMCVSAAADKGHIVQPLRFERLGQSSATSHIDLDGTVVSAWKLCSRILC